MAAPLATPMAAPSTIIGTTALFLTGALVMRGAGCTINDLWDRNLDPHVTRTRLRPIARGAITPLNALVFTGGQLLTGLARVTNYPQAVLGLTFSWGAIMGFPALGVDLLANSAALMAAACLYGSNIAWTVLYDMIYAHMDIRDDVKAGIKSIALAHEHNTKAVLSGLAVVQTGLLAAAGMAIGAGPVYFVGTCGSALLTTGVMITRVNLKSVWRHSAGPCGEYLAKYLGWYRDEEDIKA
ncbi:Para-hydroxybenzoate--polyprenyltransferase, mitochondrial precursor (PHB:polyprenyltransferase) [Taxawa tesnikishii (nom. ined.)]|nr:Para-hydroxybenzoate--polyprenyltransferase, mitochondrial precursor (PHB:polyprenyltransferase) [Dothideales sp. JES 119]